MRSMVRGAAGLVQRASAFVSGLLRRWLLTFFDVHRPLQYRPVYLRSGRRNHVRH
jgi:hypothetical protein